MKRRLARLVKFCRKSPVRCRHHHESGPSHVRREYSRSLFAFGLRLALLWFLPLNWPHLFEPDEGRYAEIPREMVAAAIG